MFMFFVNNVAVKRYNEETLQVTYKDKNIYDVLEMTIEDAGVLFETTKIKTKLQTLNDVGLGYIKFKQSANNFIWRRSKELN